MHIPYPSERLYIINPYQAMPIHVLIREKIQFQNSIKNTISIIMNEISVPLLKFHEHAQEDGSQIKSPIPMCVYVYIFVGFRECMCVCGRVGEE